MMLCLARQPVSGGIAMPLYRGTWDGTEAGIKEGTQIGLWSTILVANIAKLEAAGRPTLRGLCQLRLRRLCSGDRPHRRSRWTDRYRNIPRPYVLHINDDSIA
jgi:hypothetical protein